jgi:hypothetical protein
MATKRVAERSTSAALVPLPRTSEEPEQLDDPRMGDVDEWGSSENMRSIARLIYDPI